MPLPLAAGGSAGEVMPYDPAPPAHRPLAAPTVVNQTNETKEAEKAAACERQRQCRMARKRQCEATEAAGLTPAEREAERAAARERKRLYRARKRRECEATEAVGLLPPVADNKANRQLRNKRHKQKRKDAKLTAAQHGHIDSDG